MSESLSIMGIGQVSACGAGVEALRVALRSGVSVPEWIPIEPARPDVLVPVLRARRVDLEQMVPSRLVRRMDPFSQSFVAAALLAVRDMGKALPPAERVGVVVASGFGAISASFALLDEIIDGGDDAGSPIRFATSVNNAPATSISALLDARGPSLAVTGFDHPVVNALRVAQGWLADGAADAVILAAGDEYHPIIGYSLLHGHGWAADGIVRPFERERCSFVPGETFAAFLLARGAEPARYGRITDFCKISDVGERRIPSEETLVLLTADGRPQTGPVFDSLLSDRREVGALTPLWGGNPTADAMTLAGAAVILKDRIVPPWVSGGRQLSVPRHVECLSVARGARGSMVSLAGGEDGHFGSSNSGH